MACMGYLGIGSFGVGGVGFVVKEDLVGLVDDAVFRVLVVAARGRSECLDTR